MQSSIGWHNLYSDYVDRKRKIVLIVKQDLGINCLVENSKAFIEKT